MANLGGTDQSWVNPLLGKDEASLYTELGARLQALALDPSTVAGSLQPELASRVEEQGVPDDLRLFGQRFMDRIGPLAYQVVCGAEAEDSAERRALEDAFEKGMNAAIPALGAMLIATLGLAPAIAAVVAAIVIKIVAQASYDAMCSVWKTKVVPKDSTAIRK